MLVSLLLMAVIDVYHFLQFLDQRVLTEVHRDSIKLKIYTASKSRSELHHKQECLVIYALG